MLSNQFLLPLHRELVIDLFAGGGGASTGIEQAIGRAVDVAINHDPEAIGLHQSNHPQTAHYCSDVFEVDPVAVTNGQPVGLLWASPDCKHFSKAKGGKPLSKKIRSLAWVVVKWAKAVRPRVIFLENVEEFQTWGPLNADQKPCPRRKGKTFKQWVGALENLGYRVEWRELRACDFGAPTIRKRFCLIARCDGYSIIWPDPTHGNPNLKETKARRLKPWRTAADCIDWSLPTQSIFDRTRPLADNTLRRIARGVVKYVLETQTPFVVSCAHGEVSPAGLKHWGSGVRGTRDPLQTVLASGNEAAIVVPPIIKSNAEDAAVFVTKFNTGATGFAVDTPMHTITAGGQQARPGTPTTQGLVTAFLAKHYGGVVGADLRQPIGTVTTVDHHSLVAAYVSKMRGDNIGHGADEPLHTISAGGTHHAAVAALLVKYYGNERDGVEISGPMHTIPTRDRFGLVTVQIDGEPYVITDIGMRMLQPHELYAAQGFPSNYQITTRADGTSLPKSSQVRMCGNSVCPPLAKALVESNYFALPQRKAA